jgi:hypothetical protein
MQSLVFVYGIIYPHSWALAAQRPPQNKPSSEARDRYRFEAADAASDVLNPGLRFHSSIGKRGGTAVAVSVVVKSYRSCWRWI